MDQIFEKSFTYYLAFYSYKGKFKKLWFWILLSIVSSVIFIYLTTNTILYVDLKSLGGFTFYWELKWVIISELFFILSLDLLRSNRNKIITKDHEQYKKPLRLTMAKRDWIEKSYNKKATDYLTLADQIMKMQSILKKSNLHNKTENFSFMRYVYSPESKARITSYFIFMLSIIFLIVLKDAEGLSETLPNIYDSSFQKLILTIAILSIMFFFILIGIVYFLRVVILIILTWWAVIKTKKDSYIFVDIFVRDLIKLQRLPKLKISNK